MKKGKHLFFRTQGQCNINENKRRNGYFLSNWKSRHSQCCLFDWNSSLFKLLLECRQTPKWQLLLLWVPFCCAGGRSFLQSSSPLPTCIPRATGVPLSSEGLLQLCLAVLRHHCNYSCKQLWRELPWWSYPRRTVLPDCCALPWMNLPVEGGITNPADPHHCWMGWLTKRGHCSVFRLLL